MSSSRETEQVKLVLERGRRAQTKGEKVCQTRAVSGETVMEIGASVMAFFLRGARRVVLNENSQCFLDELQFRSGHVSGSVQ